MLIFSTKYKEQPNFLHGNAIFGHMGSFKGAAQKHQIMNYEQLLSCFFMFSWTKKQTKTILKHL